MWVGLKGITALKLCSTFIMLMPICCSHPPPHVSGLAASFVQKRPAASPFVGLGGAPGLRLPSGVLGIPQPASRLALDHRLPAKQPAVLSQLNSAPASFGEEGRRDPSTIGTGSRFPGKAALWKVLAGPQAGQ